LDIQKRGDQAKYAKRRSLLVLQWGCHHVHLHNNNIPTLTPMKNWFEAITGNFGKVEKEN
jgi:hypothetical protein